MNPQGPAPVFDTAGFRQPIISGAAAGATRSLSATESGSLVLFDRAAGTIFTLPAPVVGTFFDFSTPVSVTSNAHKVITDSASTFIVGSLLSIDSDTSNAIAAWTANGTTHRAVSMNGTTSGGLLGTTFRLTAISTTVWMLSGVDVANGVVITPVATS